MTSMLQVKTSLAGAVVMARPVFGGRLSTTRQHLQLHARSSAGTGGNVIDRPTTTPDITKRRDTRKRRPPTYRVLLHNDNINKREYVVQVLLKVVEGYTVEDALNVMQEAHHNGLAIVTVCSQEQAESICEGMRNGGLISTMEPAGPNGT